MRRSPPKSGFWSPTGPLHVAEHGETNGCVPRSATIGYLHEPDDLGDLCYDVLKTVTLTHSHPDAAITALIFAVGICHAVAGYDPAHVRRTICSTLPHLTRIAGGGGHVAEAILTNLESQQWEGDLAAYVDYLESTVGMRVAARSSAVSGILLGLSGAPPRQLLPYLLRRKGNGDLDSVAAIYGALAGAFDPMAVPASWIFAIEQYNRLSVSEVATRLHHVRMKGGDRARSFPLVW